MYTEEHNALFIIANVPSHENVAFNVAGLWNYYVYAVPAYNIVKYIPLIKSPA